MARQVTTIKAEWVAICDASRLSEVDRALLWGRAFLNPFAFEGLPEDILTEV